jgi:hypothetical protein
MNFTVVIYDADRYENIDHIKEGETNGVVNMIFSLNQFSPSGKNEGGVLAHDVLLRIRDVVAGMNAAGINNTRVEIILP